jgi:UDP-GlcNAc:undecaprenyl-phosphate/decaprenyl-phosphate GlcNAc-1-phosphate transferase
MLGGLAFASFAVTVAGLWLLLGRLRTLALDRPNERSLHERPVPRTGGIALLAGALVSVAFGASELWLALGLAIGLGALSFLDDVRSLATPVRLAAHLAAAGVLAWYVLSPMHPLELAVLALAVAWMTNLYNFMDGSDGLAGGMALIGFGAYAMAAAGAGDGPLLALTLGLAAAALGFLLFNFPPAKIFLGDVGSVPLGFLAGALGLVGWRDDLWPLWFPVVVFAPFIGDASLTLVRRALRGEKVWQAHREHYYQRLVRLGFGHRGTAYVAYALMLLCAALALYGRGGRPALQWAIVASSILGLGAVAAWIELRWRRQR